jgi:hypothetical protein
MGEIELVVKYGGEKERGGFGPEDEGSERGRLKCGRAGTTDFRRGKISFRADEKIQGRGFSYLSNSCQKGGQRFGFGLE